MIAESRSHGFPSGPEVFCHIRTFRLDFRFAEPDADERLDQVDRLLRLAEKDDAQVADGGIPAAGLYGTS